MTGIKKAAALAMGILLILVCMSVLPYIAATESTFGYQVSSSAADTELPIVRFSAADRAQISEPCKIVLCIDVSESMSWLEDSPERGKSYSPGITYPREDTGITDETVLYAHTAQEYKPVKLISGNWCVVACDGTSISRVGSGGSGSDSFTQEVYTKGECKTRMEYLQSAASDFIDKIAGKDNRSQIGIVFFSENITEYPMTALSGGGAEKLKEQISGVQELLSQGTNNSAALDNAYNMLSALSGERECNMYIVNFTDGVTRDGENAQSVADEIKCKLGAKVFCVGIFGESINPQNAVGFLKLVSSDPDELYVGAGPELAGFFEKIAGQIETTACLTK